MSIIHTRKPRLTAFFMFPSIFAVLFAVLIIVLSSVFAISVGNDIELEFNLESSISITTSGSLAIDNLLSGGDASSSSGALVVTVDSNSAGGYTLGATVGSTENATTNLISATTNYAMFSMLDATSEAVSLSSFTGNTWGISTDGGTTFMGLPLYTSTAKIIKTTNSPAASDTTSIKLGARAASGAESGVYTNVINFIAVTQMLPFDGITTMQAMTPAICEAASVNDSTQLHDTRDNKTYWVTKLADGNCWMTQNLDLDLSDSTTLTSADTDVTSDWTPSRSTIEENNISAWVGSPFLQYSYDPGDSYMPYDGESYISASNLDANSVDLHYHRGNLYNWSAALAMNDTSSVDSAPNTNPVTTSICPKGWRLPTIYDEDNVDGDFIRLNNAYGGAIDTGSVLQNPPLFFAKTTLIHDWYNTPMLDYDDYLKIGFYWSSTVYMEYDNQALAVQISDSSVLIPDITNRPHGFAIRCIARGIEDISQITTMQQFGELTSYERNAVLESMSTGDQYQLRDTRDNKLYWVSKLDDGHVWMTQNLDLALSTSTTLTPADSDVSADWTPNSNTQIATYDDIGEDSLWNDYNTTSYSYRPASDNRAGTTGTFYDGIPSAVPAYMVNGTTMSSYKTEAECIAGGYSQSDCQHWSVGTYYSWYAATAGTGNGDIVTDGEDATDSICPSGWHLPSSTSVGEFQELINAADLYPSDMTEAPYYFLYSGGYEGDSGEVGSVGGAGNYYGDGNYSSRTAYSALHQVYILTFNPYDIGPSTVYFRSAGLGVRCIANYQ